MPQYIHLFCNGATWRWSDQTEAFYMDPPVGAGSAHTFEKRFPFATRRLLNREIGQAVQQLVRCSAGDALDTTRTLEFLTRWGNPFFPVPQSDSFRSSGYGYNLKLTPGQTVRVDGAQVGLADMEFAVGFALLAERIWFAYRLQGGRDWKAVIEAINMPFPHGFGQQFWIPKNARRREIQSAIFYVLREAAGLGKKDRLSHLYDLGLDIGEDRIAWTPRPVALYSAIMIRFIELCARSLGIPEERACCFPGCDRTFEREIKPGQPRKYCDEHSRAIRRAR